MKVDIDELIKWITLISVLIGFGSSFIKFGQQKQMLLDSAKTAEEAKTAASTATNKADQATQELVNLKGTITGKLDRLDAMRESVARMEERLLGLQRAFEEMRELKKT